MGNDTASIEYVPSGPSAPPKEKYLWRFNHRSTVIGDTAYILGGVVARQNEDQGIGSIPSFNSHPNAVTNVGAETYPMGDILSIPLDRPWTNQTVNIRTVSKAPFRSFAPAWVWPDEASNSFYFPQTETKYAPSVEEGGQPVNGSDALLKLLGGHAETNERKWFRFTRTPNGGSWSQQADLPFHRALTWFGSSVINGVAYTFGAGGLYDIGVMSYDLKRQKKLATVSLPMPTYTSYDAPLSMPVPTYGEKGLMLSFGLSPVFETWYSPVVDETLRNVSIYDPSSEKLHWQATSGDIPKSSSNLCGASTTNHDGSIVDIFILAGNRVVSQYSSGRAETRVLTDVFTLSIPAFHWTKVGSIHQRWKATCNLVGSSQMLVVGGWGSSDSLTPSIDYSDPNAQGLSIFDMETLEWSAQYEPRTEPYQPSEGIMNLYRDRSMNDTSWSSPELADLFRRTRDGASAYSHPESTNAPSDDNGKLIGAILGTIGAVFVIALTLFLWWRFHYRRRSSTEDNEQWIKPELAGDFELQKSHKKVQSTEANELGTQGEISLKGELEAQVTEIKPTELEVQEPVSELESASLGTPFELTGDKKGFAREEPSQVHELE